jgi:hypothetical protein
MKTSQLSQRLPKPASNRLWRILFAIIFVGLTVAILNDILNDFENNSWGLSSARFSNQQIVIFFICKILGLGIIAIRSVVLNFSLDFIDQVSKLERFLARSIFITLLGLTTCFIVLFADVFRLYGLIDASNQNETMTRQLRCTSRSLPGPLWATGTFYQQRRHAYLRQRRPL